MRDDSEYLIVQLDGSFDASTGMFNGKGGATVTREKLLFGEMGSSIPSGFSPVRVRGTIVDNALTEVGGNVPFMVQDEVGVLIEGAEGKPDRIGTLHRCRLRLSRPGYRRGVGTIPCCDSSRALGGWVVVDSELRRLGGTLSLNSGSRRTLGRRGRGEYDAVASELLWAGSATLLRPWELLGGEVIVEGYREPLRSKIANWFGRVGKVLCTSPHSTASEPLRWIGARKGTRHLFGVRYLDFTLLDDPPRAEDGGNGRVPTEDNTFHAEGGAGTKMNPMIGVNWGSRGGEGVPLDPV